MNILSKDRLMVDDNLIKEVIKLSASDPAKILVEKISDVIGGFLKPYQIQRIAKAEVEAGIIRAKGEVEVSEIQQRGVARLYHEAGKKQKNIEDIASKAINLLNDKSNPREIDDDWLSNFFDKCGLVSDEEMKKIWGGILASEANKVGSFKKRTINAVANFEKNDARLFTNLCCFGVKIFDEFTPLVFDTNAKIYQEKDINFSSINHLESIGLITQMNGLNYAKKGMQSEFTVKYFDKTIKVKLKENEKKITIGRVLLTDIGRELSAICGTEQINQFPAYLKTNWGSRVTSL
jgi:hypothetical protein